MSNTNTPVLPTSPASTPQGRRLDFLDNLRTLMIFLVVLNHSGLVYESSGIGGLFWLVDDPAVNNLSGIVNLLTDLFVMFVLFFVSGYLTPSSLERKGGRAFVVAKAKRLMLPWALAVLALMPLYKVIFLYSRGLPQESWTTYFHFSNGIFSQSWLWYLPVLFLFDLLYLLLRRAGLSLRKVSPALAATGLFVVGFAQSLAMDLRGWLGWTKTFLLDFQTERLALYFMVFLLGTLCFEHRVFDSEPKGKTLYITLSCMAWIPMNLYLVVLINFFLKPGQPLVSPLGDRLMVWTGFYLSMLSMLYLVVQGFRRWGHRQGKIWKELGRNAYGVYIIHTIVLGVLGTALLDVALPSLAKYPILTLATYGVSNLLISGYHRVKVARPLSGASAAPVVSS